MPKKKRKINLTAWMFILPALLVVVLLMLYPVLSSVFYSFTNILSFSYLP